MQVATRKYATNQPPKASFTFDTDFEQDAFMDFVSSLGYDGMRFYVDTKQKSPRLNGVMGYDKNYVRGYAITGSPDPVTAVADAVTELNQTAQMVAEWVRSGRAKQDEAAVLAEENERFFIVARQLWEKYPFIYATFVPHINNLIQNRDNAKGKDKNVHIAALNSGYRDILANVAQYSPYLQNIQFTPREKYPYSTGILMDFSKDFANYFAQNPIPQTLEKSSLPAAQAQPQGTENKGISPIFIIGGAAILLTIVSNSNPKKYGKAR